MAAPAMKRSNEDELISMELDATYLETAAAGGGPYSV